MGAYQLDPQPAQRVWGRRDLPAGFAQFASDAAAVGEVCYGDIVTRRRTDLLVKYLFTSERLSIQVHPPLAAAVARGLPVGKDEAWLVLEAEPGATIGLGLRRAVTAAELKEAALDGSLEALVDWRPVQRGDFLYSPAGTIHAIGAGLVLVEVQQNLTMTYRLYDYGRPRALHLDDAVAVASLTPLAPQAAPVALREGRLILAHGGEVVVERWQVAGEAVVNGADAPVLVVPLGPGGSLDGAQLPVGSVWRVDGWPSSRLRGELDVMIAYPGPAVRSDIDVAPSVPGRAVARPHHPERRGARWSAAASASFTR